MSKFTQAMAAAAAAAALCLTVSGCAGQPAPSTSSSTASESASTSVSESTASGSTASSSSASGSTTAEKSASDQAEVDELIQGKWKLETADASSIAVDGGVVWTFEGDGAMKSTHPDKTRTDAEGAWLFQAPATYSIDGKTVNLDLGGTKATFAIDSIDDAAMTGVFTYGESGQSRNTVFKRISVDYSQEIIGTWEAAESTDGTLKDPNYRFEFHADGSYAFYTLEAGEWTPANDSVSKYMVDGDVVATCWQTADSDQYDSDWWDISTMEGDTMEWTPLRTGRDGDQTKPAMVFKRIS